MLRYYAGLLVCCLAISACTTSTVERHTVQYKNDIDDYIVSLSITGPISCDDNSVVVQGITQHDDQLVIIANLSTASSASVIQSRRDGFILHAPPPPLPSRDGDTQYRLSTLTSDGVMTTLAHITVDERACGSQ